MQRLAFECSGMKNPSQAISQEHGVGLVIYFLTVGMRFSFFTTSIVLAALLECQHG